MKNAAAKLPQSPVPDIAPERARHLTLSRQQIATETGRRDVVVDEGESPLVWLSRRQGRDGRALIEPHQLQAGERLRRDFTMAHLMPRTTSDWSRPLSSSGFNPDASATDVMIAARQQVHRALDAVGPELSGLLVDVCCFLKRLEDIERERQWPARSAKVVLQLALTQLARHYGYGERVKGAGRRGIRSWQSEDAAFTGGD
ncbi:DUF6456 domain-containing protein [Microbacteriaceae bacterium K1510]|nr:DUF6456 domain-containing protein [Microbacteriaceae bacterium K1510]